MAKKDEGTLPGGDDYRPADGNPERPAQSKMLNGESHNPQQRFNSNLSEQDGQANDNDGRDNLTVEQHLASRQHGTNDLQGEGLKGNSTGSKSATPSVNQSNPSGYPISSTSSGPQTQPGDSLHG